MVLTFKRPGNAVYINTEESAGTLLRLLVKRILRKFGCPPDKQEQATQTVLEQTELLCAKWM
jgi:type I restriction enzyme R subunit